MAMPYIRTPLTDIASGFENYEASAKCRSFYLQFAKCQQAWGGNKQQSKCRDEYEDLMECTYGVRQQQRALEIYKQREKLHRDGKIKQRYMEAPPPDSISQSHK